MKNSIFLERASKLQKEYAEFYNTTEGMKVIGICRDNFQVTSKTFRKCEAEGLLNHISETFQQDHFGSLREQDYYRLKAMTKDGVIVIALEDRDERKGE